VAEGGNAMSYKDDIDMANYLEWVNTYLGDVHAKRDARWIPIRHGGKHLFSAKSDGVYKTLVRFSKESHGQQIPLSLSEIKEDPVAALVTVGRILERRCKE
jgi:hypothetical protein